MSADSPYALPLQSQSARISKAPTLRVDSVTSTTNGHKQNKVGALLVSNSLTADQPGIPAKVCDSVGAVQLRQQTFDSFGILVTMRSRNAIALNRTCIAIAVGLPTRSQRFSDLDRQFDKSRHPPSEARRMTRWKEPHHCLVR